MSPERKLKSSWIYRYAKDTNSIRKRKGRRGGSLFPLLFQCIPFCDSGISTPAPRHPPTHPFSRCRSRILALNPSFAPFNTFPLGVLLLLRFFSELLQFIRVDSISSELQFFVSVRISRSFYTARLELGSTSSFKPNAKDITFGFILSRIKLEWTRSE